MLLAAVLTVLSGISRPTRIVLSVYPLVRACATVSAVVATAAFWRATRQDAYNILWAVVFGFATLNILTLAARRLEPNRRGLHFGEVLALMVVAVAVILLAWEMLSEFHIFPLKIRH